MKKYQCFEFTLLLLLVFLGFSIGLAQKKTGVKKKNPASPTLKDTLEIIEGNLKSQISYMDDKENASCPNQIIRKITYEQGVFTDNVLGIKLKDEVKRAVCSVNLTNSDKITSSSESQDDAQISVSLKDLDSEAVKTGNCPIDGGYQRKEGNCYFVSLETLFGRKSIKIDKSNSYWFNSKQTSDKKPVSYTTNQYQIFFTDEETANNVSKAFAQAIKLASGKN